MLSRPVLNPHYSVHRVEPDSVVVISEIESLALRGEFYYHLAPFLDGRSLEEIARAMEGQATLEEVQEAVEILRQGGYVQEASAMAVEEAAFWSALGQQADGAARQRAELGVNLLNLSRTDPGAFRSGLESLGFPQSAPGDLGLVLVDDYLEEGLAAYNREALEAGRPWLLVKPLGRKPWIGPFFVPGQTACWECLAQRQRFNRHIELLMKGPGGFTPTARGATALSVGLVAHLAVLALARRVGAGQDPVLEGRLQTLDLLTMQSETHTLVRRPQCPACGSHPSPDPSPDSRQESWPLPLRAGVRPTVGEDGYQRGSCQEILQRYGHHVSRLTGVVSELVPVAFPGTQAVHVWNSGVNLSRPMSAQRVVTGRGFRMGSSGKGSTAEQAQAGALCEAIERYSSCHFGEEPRRRASLGHLGEAAIHPGACMLFSERQYAEREEWNRRHKRLHWVPLPFDTEGELDWSPLWSFTRREVRYLPTAYSYYLHPSKAETRYAPADSNGNAAGRTLEEAILGGFFELVERDAVALWWYNGVTRPGLDLDSFDLPYLDRLRRYYRSLGRQIWALDLTADLGIPAVVAGSARIEQGDQIMLGFGAHSDPHVALLRACTEMNQFLAMAGDLARQQPPAEPDPERFEVTWFHTATLDRHPCLVPQGTPRRLQDLPQAWSGGDCKEYIERCQALVEARGLEFLVLDQTRADVGMPVVKVVVPGLRHFWPRYGPGRLYEVPVQLGWLEKPHSEEQLNLTPIFW